MKLLRIVAGASGWLALAVLWFWAWHLKDPHLRFMRVWELPLLSALLLGGIAIAWRFELAAAAGIVQASGRQIALGQPV